MHDLRTASWLSVVGALALPTHAAAHGPELWCHSEPQQVQAFNPSQAEVPESITIDSNGSTYFSLSSSVMKRSAYGTTTVFGTLPIAAFALGVKVGPDHCVYAVSTSLSETPGAFVWKMCSEGQVEQLAALDPAGGPNDLAFDGVGNWYVTDPFLGKIWQVDSAGHASIWLDDPLLHGNTTDPVLVFHSLGVDGIAFDEHKRNLYVDNLDRGTILRIEVLDGGRPGVVSVFASDPTLRGADGLAFNDHGDLYVAVNAQNRIVAINRHGSIRVVAEGGLLDAPSSLAFGTVPSTHHHLYITSSAFRRTFGYEAGTPAPALLKMRVRTHGLPLP